MKLTIRPTLEIEVSEDRKHCGVGCKYYIICWLFGDRDREYIVTDLFRYLRHPSCIEAEVKEKE